jgi:hypothetical protein
MGRNEFVGSLRDSFEPFQVLEFVDVSDNMITGALPSSLFDVPTIEILYFDVNAFTGTIPENYGSAANLRDLYLNNNTFVGTVPSIQPGQLGSLQEFRLEVNDITGTMPDSICALPDLVALTADCAGDAFQCSCCTACVV